MIYGDRYCDDDDDDDHLPIFITSIGWNVVTHSIESLPASLEVVLAPVFLTKSL